MGGWIERTFKIQLSVWLRSIDFLMPFVLISGMLEFFSFSTLCIYMRCGSVCKALPFGIHSTFDSEVIN